LFNATIKKKNEKASIRIKKDLPIDKYGGYNSATTAYFVVLEFEEKKGNRIKNIIGVPIYIDNMLNHDSEVLIKYFEGRGMKNVRILVPKIKKNALIVVNGFPMRIRGESGSKDISLKGNVQLVLNKEFEECVRLIEKYLEKNKAYAANEKIDGITDQKLIELYDVLCEKLEVSIYKNRPSNQVDKLRCGRNDFVKLNLGDKARLINEILNMFRCDITTSANLSLIKGKARTATIVVNRNTMGKSNLLLINQSITGLFENKIEI